MLRPENVFLPNFSSGSDTGVLTSAKSCPFSIVLTAALQLLQQLPKDVIFTQTPGIPRRREKNSPSCSLNEWKAWSVPESRLIFFLLRKQAHSDGPMCSCEARGLAYGGRSPWQPNGGQHVPPHPALRKTAPPSWSLNRNWQQEVSKTRTCQRWELGKTNSFISGQVPVLTEGGGGDTKWS